MYCKPKVAFVCRHNSCRSQIAEALGKNFASGVFDSFSGGTETAPQINRDAVRLIKKIYSIDMEKTQYPKMTDVLPPVDIVIKMGCDAVCPFLESKYEEDWGLEDPTGKSDKEFIAIIEKIEQKVRELALKIPSMQL